METFQIQEKTKNTADKRKKAQIGHSDQYGHKQIYAREKNPEHDVRNDSDPLLPKRITDAVQKIVNKAADDPAGHANYKIEKLTVFRHLNSFWRAFPFAPPNFTADTSPLAEKFPLPLLNAKTFNPLPVTDTFFPFTVSEIEVSENASTLSTPVIVIFFCCSIVRTLCAVSFCISYLYAAGSAEYNPIHKSCFLDINRKNRQKLYIKPSFLRGLYIL